MEGLIYLSDFVEEQEEKDLIEIIDRLGKWSNELKRRTQHYGYKYDYTKKKIDNTMYLGKVPWWLRAYTLRLIHEGVFEKEPDQVIINEYMPGQGISKHIDCPSCFGRTIASLSLGSTCSMDLEHKDLPKKGSIMLAPRSLLVLSDEARYNWLHSIPARLEDKLKEEVLLRTRRVSLTFRNIILDK